MVLYGTILGSWNSYWKREYIGNMNTYEDPRLRIAPSVHHWKFKHTKVMVKSVGTVVPNTCVYIYMCVYLLYIYIYILIFYTLYTHLPNVPNHPVTFRPSQFTFRPLTLGSWRLAVEPRRVGNFFNLDAERIPRNIFEHMEKTSGLETYNSG